MSETLHNNPARPPPLAFGGARFCTHTLPPLPSHPLHLFPCKIFHGLHPHLAVGGFLAPGYIVSQSGSENLFATFYPWSASFNQLQHPHRPPANPLPPPDPAHPAAPSPAPPSAPKDFQAAFATLLPSLLRLSLPPATQLCS